MILMCGIAGIWGKVREKEVRHMMGSLTHRGPDAEGMYISKDDVQALYRQRWLYSYGY